MPAALLGMNFCKFPMNQADVPGGYGSSHPSFFSDSLLRRQIHRGPKVFGCLRHGSASAFLPSSRVRWPSALRCARLKRVPWQLLRALPSLLLLVSRATLLVAGFVHGPFLGCAHDSWPRLQGTPWPCRFYNGGQCTVDVNASAGRAGAQDINIAAAWTCTARPGLSRGCEVLREY